MTSAPLKSYVDSLSSILYYEKKKVKTFVIAFIMLTVLTSRRIRVYDIVVIAADGRGLRNIHIFGPSWAMIRNKERESDLHYLWARTADREEITAYRNLALNPADQHKDVSCYPHATANVETRGESVFAARNAIDGVRANLSHGQWPYQSWGINRQDDAVMKVDFGRKICIRSGKEFILEKLWRVRR